MGYVLFTNMIKSHFPDQIILPLVIYLSSIIGLSVFVGWLVFRDYD